MSVLLLCLCAHFLEQIDPAQRVYDTKYLDFGLHANETAGRARAVSLSDPRRSVVADSSRFAPVLCDWFFCSVSVVSGS
jgi:hypothetical protein